MKNTCLTCRFWHMTEFTYNGVPRPCEGGSCHRHAPTVPKYPSDGPQWPRVRSSDFCGDYKIQPDAVALKFNLQLNDREDAA